MPDARPLRFCDVCGGLDDHPRHVLSIGRANLEDFAVPADVLKKAAVAVAADDSLVGAFAQLANGRVQVRHMDCCAAAGCETCQATEAENGGRRHQELIDHLAAQRGSQEG